MNVDIGTEAAQFLSGNIAYPNGEEGGTSLIQNISTCRHRLRGRGGGVSTLCFPKSEKAPVLSKRKR
jgi:hypothetical protein